jgi:hypothetical protein
MVARARTNPLCSYPSDESNSCFSVAASHGQVAADSAGAKITLMTVVEFPSQMSYLAAEVPGAMLDANLQQLAEHVLTEAKKTLTELSKRLSPNLGLSLGGTLILLDPDQGPTIAGFDNMEIQLKYVFLKSPELELIVAGGMDIDVGGTGRTRGGVSFSTFTPSLFSVRARATSPRAAVPQAVAVTGALGSRCRRR